MCGDSRWGYNWASFAPLSPTPGGKGKIIIEKNAVIGAGCTIVCASGQSLTVGEGSVISAGSVVQNNIPPYTLCAGPRIKAVATVTVPFTLQTSYQDFIRGLKPLVTRGKQDAMANKENV